MNTPRRAPRLKSPWTRLLMGCALLAVCAPAFASELPVIPAQRLVANDLTIMRINPVGLENRLRFGWQQKLYEGTSKATNNNFWFAGTYLRFNPALPRAAARIELQPAAVFNLTLSAEYLHYYGNFTFMQSRRSALDALSDTDLEDNVKGAMGNYSAGGLHVTIEPLLQFAVGPVVVRNKLFLAWFDMALQRDDQVWYEPTLDVAVPGTGWLLANTLDVLYRRPIAEATLTVGVRYSLVQPLYEQEHLRDGEDPDEAGEANNHHRLGLLAAYTFYDRGFTSFNKPSVVLIVSRYLDHRYRVGKGPGSVSANVPYAVLAFAFQSDLLGK